MTIKTLPPRVSLPNRGTTSAPVAVEKAAVPTQKAWGTSQISRGTAAQQTSAFAGATAPAQLDFSQFRARKFQGSSLEGQINGRDVLVRQNPQGSKFLLTVDGETRPMTKSELTQLENYWTEFTKKSPSESKLQFRLEMTKTRFFMND